MDFLKKNNLKATTIIALAGLALVLIVVVGASFRFIGSSFNSVFRKNSESVAYQGMAMDYAGGGVSVMKGETGSMNLSLRNVATAYPSPMPPEAPVTVGDNSEAFEVTEYSATIETRDKNTTCKSVADLKAKDYVIFENASESDKTCNYTFKVKRSNVEEVLAFIKGLDPKDINENTYTIKRQVDDYTGEIDILQKKLASVDETLTKAISSYDEVAEMATKIQNVDTLAKIINNKIDLIERLAQERINVNSQLERIQRAKAEQLDRLEYTYFHVNIYENKFVDGESLKDSWKNAVKEFVRDLNNIAQDLTVNLVTVLLVGLQYLVYLLILVVVAKYFWKMVKYIWMK